MMLARRENPAFAGGWRGSSAASSPVRPELSYALAALSRGPRQSVAGGPPLTTWRPKWGAYALGQGFDLSSRPGCEYRVDSQLRVKTINWTDGSASGTNRP